MHELTCRLIGKELVLDRLYDGCRVVGAFTDVLSKAEVFDYALEAVSESRKRKALSYRFERDQHLSLLAGLLLDMLLGDYELCERDMSYSENEHGKPSFVNRPYLFFSLAHSGNMAVAALAAHPVGVDVEYLDTFSYDLADPFEWTTMESVGKAIGVGVGAYVDSGEFSIPDGFEIEHHKLDSDNGHYLVCIAQRLQ